MWFDGQRQPNTIYVANTSRGKDSTAMLRAIQIMGWPLDMICAIDIWATQDIPAELPPMVKFKAEYDRKVLKMMGVPVTHLCATNHSQIGKVEREREREREREKRNQTESVTHDRLSYEDLFYREMERGKFIGTIKGFPQTIGSWCKDLKTKYIDFRASVLQKYIDEIENASQKSEREEHRRLPISNDAVVQQATESERSEKTKYIVFLDKPVDDGQKINIVHYIGIAADEPSRIAKHMPKKDKVMPLVQIGWDEDLCGLEATYLDMLSPTYSDGQCRDGCWFCHNQGVASLRRLRRDYPDLWAILLKWDSDSPVTFHADGHTVHDFDRRFALEDKGLIRPDERFRWSMLDEELNYSLF